MVSHERPNGASGSAHAEKEELERLLEAIAVDGVTLAREARKLARIERERVRLAVESSFALALGMIVGGIAACVVAIAAGLHMLDGLTAGLDVWLGSAWAADLIGGAIALAVLAGAVWTARTLRDHARVTALRRKLGEDAS